MLVGSSAIGCEPRRGGHAAGHPEQAQKVVLVGNIGKFSLVLRQPGEGLSLQIRRMTDDDLWCRISAGRRPQKCPLWGRS